MALPLGTPGDFTGHLPALQQRFPVFALAGRADFQVIETPPVQIELFAFQAETGNGDGRGIRRWLPEHRIPGIDVDIRQIRVQPYPVLRQRRIDRTEIDHATFDNRLAVIATALKL